MVGGWFWAGFTRMLTAADVVLAQSLSTATAVSEYVSAVTFDHVAEYGALVAEPIGVVPAKKSTRVIVPSASLAAAVTVTLFPAVNVVPSAGDVTATVGGWFAVEPL